MYVRTWWPNVCTWCMNALSELSGALTFLGALFSVRRVRKRERKAASRAMGAVFRPTVRVPSSCWEPEMSHGHDIDAADWTDDDLLTRQEAGGRLKGEIDEVRDRLAGLTNAPAVAGHVEASRRLLTRRLTALEKAYAAL